ncbi:hypothetical protein Cgig2_009452 [Carnegiea gigantea]|uniref:DUF4283 domain-containing protein n=1 Tax=Carnegiea gigantea TaxID=171969 RepID=A0A9Q1K6U9_9CARY|nr:hypothetical protein Cgig2_009452 [Carnegiea gigantea]
MARGGRKGRARPARDIGRPETPVVAPDDTPDSPSIEQGEKSNETVDASNVEAANKQQQDSSLPTLEAAAMKSPIKGTYVAMADPEEGTTLNFVTSPMVTGMKCAKIETEDVQSELDFWQSAVLCSVIGANPPLEVLEGFVRRIWKAYEIDRISWLQDSFPEYIDFVNEHDMVVRQKVEYEWKPSKCKFCRMYGHSDAECRKKPIPRTEFTQVIRTPSGPSAPTQPSTDADGFTQVRRKTTGIVSKEQSTPSHLQCTPFLVEVQQATGTEGEGLPQWKESAAGT